MTTGLWSSTSVAIPEAKITAGEEKYPGMMSLRVHYREPG